MPVNTIGALVVPSLMIEQHNTFSFRNRLPNKSQDFSKYLVFSLFGVFFILDYDSMCSEMDFTPEKSFSSNYKNSQLLLTAAAALSQNGQIAV